MNTSKIITTLLSLLFAFTLPAQEEGFQRTSALDKSTVLPNSPEASSLGKFGEFNISAYTGAPSLQVNLLTIAGKTTSVPINLVYNGTAIKVDNREGSTGVSWNLTANYSIIRNVVANPDLDINYYSKKDTLNPQTYTDQFVENKLLYDIARGFVESQSDNFYLSGPFGTSKFYISPHKIVVQKEHKNLLITPSFESDGDISKFTVRDDKGVSYEYSAVEETDLYIDDQFGGEIGPAFLNYRFNSAWKLTKITGTNSIEQFLFSYQTATQQYALDINPYYYQSKTFDPLLPGNPNCCMSAVNPGFSVGSTNTSNIIGRKHLLNIKYVLGTDTLERVLFEFTDNPCPDAGDTDKKLDRIRCLKGDNGLVNIKDYEFTYDLNCSAINRLLLTKVQEKSADGLDIIEPHEFTYETQFSFPNYISTSLDHFGYFNNRPNGNTLIPKIKLQGTTSVLNPLDADRNPVESSTRTGILLQVKFPTGGYKKYNWEMHQAAGLGAGNYYDYDPTQDAALDREVGGLRIESIEHFDCDNTLLTKHSYRYEKSGSNPANQSSSGLMLNEVVYTTTPTYNNCPIQVQGGSGGPCNIIHTCVRFNISASSKSTLGTIKGSNIGYSRVEEIIEANDASGETSGKTVYFFKNEKLSQFGLKDEVENGLLTKKEIYDANGKILDRSLYTYSTDEGETRKRESFFGFRVVAKQVQDNKYMLCKAANGSFSWKTEDQTSGCVDQVQFNTKFERRFTEHLQRWVYQSERTDTRFFYHENGTLIGEVSTTTDYIYGDTTTNQPTETIVSNSDGKVYKTVTHFVNSFDDTEYPVVDDAGLFVRAMQLKGMTSFPLVQAQYIDNQLVYKTKLNYSNQSGLTLPYKLYEQFPTTSDLLAEVFDAYDGVGNLWQGHRHYEHSSGESQPIAMLYSNGNSRMAAQVKNATLGEIAYTSFETNETYQGNWTVPRADTEIRFNNIARTGKGHYQPFTNSLVGEVISKIVDPGQYYVSYYTNSPNNITISGTDISILSTKTSSDHPNWTFVRHKIEVTSRNNLMINVAYFVAIDELRLYPADALMTTFAYDKDTRLVIGIMDENALPARFEYDGLLRLTGVQNFDDHYLSLTEYLYKNQTNANNSIRNWMVLKEGQTNENTAKNLGVGDVIKVFSYFDGIGRNLLETSVGTSPTGNDQVQLHRYDKFGRQVKQFLPYTALSNGGAFRSSAEMEQQSFIQAQTDYTAGDSNFGFVETELEFSPLNRVFKQRAPGSQFNNHPTETKYNANGPNEVRDFHGINTWYPADSLFEITQLDENGNRVVIFTDKIGRKIMQEQEGSKTYFLYNNLGFLEQVIQPEAAQKGHDTPMLSYLDAVIQEGSFLYTYDSEHRMKTKIVPGCQAYTYFYDDLDQLVMTEDGNSFKTFTKYDKLGRVIITGKYKGTATPSTSQVVFEERNTTAPHYYSTNQSFPDDGNIDIYSVNYYDDYDLDNNNVEEIIFQAATGYDADDYEYVRGLPTASKVGILKNDGTAPSTYLNAYTFYDQFRRVIHSRKDNHLAGQDKVWSQYNFPGWLEKTRREHNTLINSQATNKIIQERWEYDDIGREKKYFHQVDSEAEKGICEKEYNERDELKTKKLGNTTGSNFLQTIDYQYNIRKWLTKINDANSLGNDLFGMNLIYDLTMVNPNHNGNISSKDWRNSTDVSKKTYTFSYDNLNRLTAAGYSQGNPESFTSDQYSTAYSYDRNGNITTLTRNGLNSVGGIGAIDDLTYNYADDGALSAITESSEKDSGFKSKMANGMGTYSYDGNGNMTADDHKGMTVSYNYLNLPTKVTKPEGTIEWIYDAAGTKLSKTVMTDHLVVNDNPMLSKEYKAQLTIESQGTVDEGSNVIFTAGQSITLKEGFVAGSDFLARILGGMVSQVRDYCLGIEYFEGSLEAIYYSDGRVKFEGGNSERQYIIRDYQGNTRVLFRDDGSGVSAEIEGYAFYPNGALHSQESDLKNNYTWGGKELQTELDLDWAMFGPRCLDSWSGKWLGVDILAEVKPGISPYAYGLGNPVRFSDPTGMIEEDDKGLMTVSTSLYGRDVAGGENSGEVLNPNFVSAGQLARDSETYTFSEGSNDMAILVGFPEDDPAVPTNQNFVSWWEKTFGDGDGKIQGAGHAGIVLINGESGDTKYFDFGRYNRPDIKRKRKKNEGAVRSSKNYRGLKVPNWNFSRSNDENVMGILKSLRRSPLLNRYGKIVGALATGLDFTGMVSYGIQMENSGYVPFGGYASSCSIGNASYCAKFARGVGAAGGINFSWSSFSGAANVVDVSKIYQTSIKVIP